MNASQWITNSLYSVAANAAAYALVQQVGLVDQIIKPGDEIMDALNAGMQFAVSQQIVDWWLRGKSTILQDGNVYRLLDDALYNAVFAYGSTALGTDDLLIDQLQKLPIPDGIKTKLIPGAVLTVASVGREILDSAVASGSGNSNLLKITHPLYSAMQLTGVSGTQAKADTLLLY